MGLVTFKSMISLSLPIEMRGFDLLVRLEVADLKDLVLYITDLLFYKVNKSLVVLLLLMGLCNLD